MVFGLLAAAILPSVADTVMGYVMPQRLVVDPSYDAASVLRAAVANMKRGSEEKINIVIVKSTIDHDASGLKEMQEKEVPGMKLDKHFADGDEVLTGSTYMVYIFKKGTFVLKGD